MVALDGSWNMDLEDVAPVAILEWIGVELGIAQRERVMPSAQSRGGGRTLIEACYRHQIRCGQKKQNPLSRVLFFAP